MPSPRPLVNPVRTRRAPGIRTGHRQGLVNRSLVNRASVLDRFSPTNVIDLHNFNLGKGKTKRKRRKTYKRRKSKRKSTKKRK